MMDYSYTFTTIIPVATVAVTALILFYLVAVEYLRR